MKFTNIYLSGEYFRRYVVENNTNKGGKQR